VLLRSLIKVKPIDVYAVVVVVSVKQNFGQTV
jgi:hypothetical protein